MTARLMRAGRHLLVEAWLPVLLVAVWWIGSASSTSLYFPPLSKIAQRFRELWLFDLVPVHLVPSLENLAMGLIAGVAVAVAAGVVIGRMPRLYSALLPLMEFMRATPIIALLPLVFALLGIGVTSKVALIALGAFWPTFLNTVDGVRSVDPQIREVTRAYRLSPVDVAFRVVLPSAMPQVIVGIRTSVSVAVVVVVGSEMFGASEGIGYFVLQAQRTYAIADMWAGIILLGLLGYVLNLLSAGLERWVLSWHRGQRAAAAVSGERA
ncbi:ABC transporter permease [Streptomyces sp. NPDC002643]